MNKPWVEHELGKRITSPESHADALLIVRDLANQLENLVLISQPKNVVECAVVGKARLALKQYREGPK
ncbi:MAG TPA: hypothetical protein VLE97_01750 [Gaiellaceae bacterium]|nr:hypothetical protein [Gaiellaceae bacterium]